MDWAAIYGFAVLTPPFQSVTSGTERRCLIWVLLSLALCRSVPTDYDGFDSKTGSSADEAIFPSSEIIPKRTGALIASNQ
jgi:hypothetical protein